jgi:RNA polymerase sigma factor (TIGR02999 family)
VSDVTDILDRAQSGDPKAAEELLPLVYQELRRLAAARMAHEAPGQTLQPTALVHEAWLRVVRTGNPRFENRTHFMAAAAEAMRRILIERARHKRSARGGGQRERVPLQESELAPDTSGEELLAVDEALDRLAGQAATAADLVKLRYFVGMTMAEAAAALGVPLRTAERLWAYAKAWLRREIGRDL